MRFILSLANPNIYTTPSRYSVLEIAEARENLEIIGLIKSLVQVTFTDVVVSNTAESRQDGKSEARLGPVLDEGPLRDEGKFAGDKCGGDKCGSDKKTLGLCSNHSKGLDSALNMSVARVNMKTTKHLIVKGCTHVVAKLARMARIPFKETCVAYCVPRYSLHSPLPCLICPYYNGFFLFAW